MASITVSTEVLGNDSYGFVGTEVEYINTTVPIVPETEYTQTDIGMMLVKLITLTPIIFTGIVGNILVIVAVFRFKNLRIVANYFIVSLALADLSVCCIVMPLGLYLEVMEGSWYLGGILCDIWVSMDVLTCTSSIWNLCVISLDRFLAITRPIQYALKRTPIMAFVISVSAWGLSFLISIPALLFVGGYDMEEIIYLDSTNSTNTSYIGESSKCQLNVSPIFQVLSSVVSFYIPCFILLLVYYKIFQSVQNLGLKGHKDKKRTRNPMSSTPPGTDNGEKPSQMTPLKTIDNNGRSPNFQKRPDKSRTKTTELQRHIEHKKAEAEKGGVGRHKRISVARERKATTVLAIVVTIFIICWLPFFITNVIIGLCSDHCSVSHTAFATVTWLGWVNSALNPVIYTIFNREFRNAFRKILCCWQEDPARRQYLSTVGTNY
ncbi:probable G-protein coupled receptor No18 [Amphiura filiformis]|uniref:probable G-protein coupled receptor No18 n=1 Tax=Amphiura filiformis TaxID=82378 RepID=UPI003B21B008